MPFKLIYGQEAILPLEFRLPTLRFLLDQEENPPKALQERVFELEKLDEIRRDAHLSLLHRQQVFQKVA